jgi:hypothetical protein
VNDRPAIEVRIATPDDMRLVKASWYESFRRGGFSFPDIGSDLYHAGHGKVIDEILARPGVTVAVAAVTEIPDEICAWVAFEKNTIHYLYCKQAYRHLKIALNLVQMCATTKKVTFKFCSHMTRGGVRLGRFLKVRFNPYLQFHPAQ